MSMRKGLIAALSLVVIAAASTTFANAPFFTGNVPDVVIGDNEDGIPGGLTVDTNFFRYLNAINILDYVDDTDSATTDLKFAFFEGTTTSNDLEINGAEQVANPEDDGTWGSDTITNPWLSFRDLVRSPNGGPAGTELDPFPNPTEPDGTTEIDSDTQALLPWHNNEAAPSELSDDDRSRDMWIVVADEDGNLISKSMVVYSMNAGDDALSSGVDFNVVFEDASPSSTGWIGTDSVTHLTKATTSEGTGYIQLQSAAQDASGDGYWGRWRQSPVAGVAPIPYVETANVIYCARLDLELNAATSSSRLNAPNIRLGAANQLDILTTMNVVKSTIAGTTEVHNPQLPNVGETRTYNMYWARNEALPDYAQQDLSGSGGIDYRGFKLFFDVLDPDTSGADKGGTWRLKKAVVGTIPRPADLTVGTLPANTLAFLLDDVTASPFTGEVAGSINGSVAQAGGNATFHSTGTAGAGKSVILYNASGFAPWMSGKLMRVIAKLSCVAAGDRASFGLARVRHETPLGNVNQEFIVKRSSFFTACVPAAGTQTPYEIYVPSFGGPNQAIVDAGASFVLFKVAVDHLNFAAGADPTNWVLHSMQYELLDEPVLP